MSSPPPSPRLRLSALSIVVIFLLLPSCATFSAPSPPHPKPHVLIAPAQFLVPADYADLCESLVSSHGFPSARCAPLTRLDWLRVVPSSPLRKFISADLDPEESLLWYYEALERGMSSILSDVAQASSGCACCPPSAPPAPASVAIVGHSIGG
eukprot:CAMPEP_0182482616 /NCGR_PEP_ID=MMETSP1319-20130603/39636_1 /TAXON_ID=172717 /ORGANISM="Bolidomonas pacifica, Strain RCC208" /LENGTH=152 /DNA_ID=CAMNT_0024684341 /DNA_START=153 /DNA_END=607 /DNA_ORIENTATION=+